MFIEILFLVAHSNPSQADGPRPSCEIRALIQRERLDASVQQVRLPDGSGFRNPFATSSARPSANLVRKTDAQMQAIFDETRDGLINETQGGRSEAELTSVQRTIIARLRATDLRIKACSSTDAPAQYNPRTSIIEVCDQSRTAPAIALVTLFGHEFGHTVDFASGHCRYVDPKKFTGSLEGQLPADVRQSVRRGRGQIIKGGDANDDSADPFGDAQESINQAREMAGSKRPFCFDKVPAPLKRVVERLVNEGQMNWLDQGIEPAQNPARATFQCLANAFGTKRAPSTIEEAERGNYFSLGEPTAQIWGARAVAHYVSAHPGVSRLEILSVSQNIDFLPIERVASSGTKEKEINRLYLADPVVQRALGCEPTSEPACMSYFRPGSTAAQPVAAPIAPARNQR